MKSIIQTFTTQTLPQNPIHGQLIFVSDTDNMLIADKTNNVLVWREYTSQSEYVSDPVTIPSYPRYLTAEVEGAENSETRYDAFKDHNLIYVLFDEWDSSMESNPRTSQPYYRKSNIFSRRYTYKAPDYAQQNNWGGVSTDKDDLKNLPHSQFEAYNKQGMSAYYPKYENEFQKGLVFPCYKDSFGYLEYAIWAGMVYLDERGVEDLESTTSSWNLGKIYNWRGYEGYGGINGWKTGKYPCWYLERFERDASNNTWYKIQYFLIADENGQYYFKGFKPYGGTEGIGLQSEHGDEKSSLLLDIPLGSNFWGLSTTGEQSNGSKTPYIYLTPEPSFSNDWSQNNSNEDSALFFDDRLNIGGAGHKEINGTQYRATSFHISPIMLDTDSTEGTESIAPLEPTELSLEEFEYDSNYKPGVPVFYPFSVEYAPDTNPGSGGDPTYNIILKWDQIKATNENLVKVRSYHTVAIREALNDIQNLLKTKSAPWDIIVDVYLRGDELLDDFYEQWGFPPPVSDGPMGVLGSAQTIEFGTSQTNDLSHLGFNDKQYIRPKRILITLDPADLFQPAPNTESTLDGVQGKQLGDNSKDGSRLYWVMIHELLHALGFNDSYFIKDKSSKLRENRNDIFPNTDLAWKQGDETYWYRGQQGLNNFHNITGDTTLIGIPMGNYAVYTSYYNGGSSLVYRSVDSLDSRPGHYVGDHDINTNSTSLTIGNERVHPNQASTNKSNYRIWGGKKYLVNQKEIMNASLYVGNLLASPVISPVTAGILNDVGWIVDYSYVTDGLNTPTDWVVDA